MAKKKNRKPVVIGNLMFDHNLFDEVKNRRFADGVLILMYQHELLIKELVRVQAERDLLRRQVSAIKKLIGLPEAGDG